MKHSMFRRSIAFVLAVLMGFSSVPVDVRATGLENESVVNCTQESEASEAQEDTAEKAFETESPETEIPETEIPETEIPETEIPETEIPETEILETEIPETEIPETEILETEIPETEVSGTEISETEVFGVESVEKIPDEATVVKSTDGVLAMGICGENVNWILDTEGVLTISGTGEMSSNPWEEFSTDIKEVVIEEGITTIYQYAFDGCTSLTSVKLPNSLNTIGGYAFSNCFEMADITIPISAVAEDYAFSYCTGVKNVTLTKGTGTGAEYKFNMLSKKPWDEATDVAITIGSGINSIKQYTFRSAKITSLIFEGSVNSIETGAFAYATVENIYFPDVKALCETNFTTSPFSLATNVYIDSKVPTVIEIPEGTAFIGDKVFYECDTLTNLTMASSVTSIGEYAFYGCDALQEVHFSDGLVYVGFEAFDTRIESIYFPNDEAWCKMQFEGQSSNPAFRATNVYINGEVPTTIQIPEGTTSIGDYAFAYLPITSIEIPKSVTYMGKGAFARMGSSITDVYIKDLESWCKIQFADSASSPVSFSSNVYVNGEIPTEIQIPDGISKIESYAFSGWGLLNKVVIPESVTSIGTGAFSGSMRLGYLTIPKSITSIGEDAFYNCTAIQSVEIADEEAWFSISFANRFASPMYYGKELYCSGKLVTEITFPEGITAIEDNKYQYCHYIKNIVIPEGVKNIGKNAFMNCSGLTNITIPKSVKFIDENAFVGCSALQRVDVADAEAWFSISFGNSYSTPMYYAKELYCNGEIVKDIVLPDGTTKIDAYAYQNCDYITSIVIPEGVEEIGEYAFDGCTNLECVVIPESVKVIGKYAFRNCTGLKKLTLPYSLSVTDYQIFYGCSNVEEILLTKGDGTIPDYTTDYYSTPWYWADSVKVVLEDGITGIGNALFKECTGVKEVVIPDSVTTLGEDAFYNCSKLNTLTMPYSLEVTKENTFYNSTSIKDLTLTKGTGVVPDYSGDNSSYTPWYNSRLSLNKLTIGEGITEIYAGAFEVELYESSNLKEVSLPEGLTKIGRDAFYNREGIQRMNIPSTLIEIDVDAFYRCYPIKMLDITDPKAFCNIKFANNSSNPLSSANSVCVNGVAVEDFVIPDGVTTIKYGAFLNCTGINSLTIPHSVTLIEDNSLPVKLVTIKVYEESYAEDYVKQKGYTNVEVLHNYEYAETIESTCTVKGYDRFVCSTCQHERYDELPLAHHYEAKYILANGKKIEYCIHGCGITKEEAEEEPDVTGTCGENLTWKLYGDTILVIEGTGAMDSYDVDAPAPWSEYEFGYCIIKEGVTTIGSSAFDNCVSLEHIAVPKTLTKVESYAFYGCNALKEVEFQKALLSIEESAFERCSALEKITVYEKAVNIAASAFYKCDALNFFGYYGSYIETYAKEKGFAFEGIGYYGTCGEDMEWLLVDNELSFVGSGNMYNYSPSKAAPWAELSFSRVVMDGLISTIGDYAFYNRKDLISIELPYNLFSIGNYAFCGCTGLTRMEMPIMLSRYGNYAFCDCTGIQEITFSGLDFLMGDGVFSGCTALKNVTIPGSPLEMGTGVFEGCIALEDVTLQGKYETIPEKTFKDCKKLASFTFPDGVTVIGKSAFKDCEKLTSLTFFDGITTIEEAAFEGCAISEITLPTTLTIIGSRAFGLNPLTSITLPDSVTTIEAGAFLGCNQLEKFVVNSTNPNFTVTNGVLFNADGTVLLLCPIAKAGTYTMPRKTVEIAAGAFLGCNQLTEIVMPSTLTTIGACAFSGTAVETFDIPLSVTKIDFTAFFGCEQLKEIVFDEKHPVYTSDGTSVYSADKTGFYLYYGANDQLTIPEGVTFIDADAFVSCKKGTRVYLPYSITDLDAIGVFEEGTLVPYIYQNCGYLRSMFKEKGVSYKSRGYKDIEWSDSKEHFSLAYEKLAEILKNKGGEVTYYHDSITLKVIQTAFGIRFTQKYTAKDTNYVGNLTYIIDREGVYQNKFNYNSKMGLSDFTGSITVDPKTIGNANNYSYNWGISGDILGDPIRDSTTLNGVNNLANMALYAALLIMQQDLLAPSTLSMRDFGFVKWDNATTIHTVVDYEQTEPTCTTDGKEAHSACALCGATADTPKLFPAIGHTEVHDNAVDATCTTDGHTAGSYCSVCGEVLEEMEILPSFGHTVVIDEEGSSPTCTEAGKIDKSHCSVCNEILSNGDELPALGHTKAVDVEAKKATCTEAGCTEESHCLVCGETLSVSKEIEALGHTEKILPGIEATEKESGLSEGCICTVCGEVLVEQVEIPALGYKIIYHLAGSSNAKDNPSHYREESKDILLASPVAGKNGYCFAGWYLDENYSTPFEKIASGSTGPVEVFAKWIPYTYTVIFSDGNGKEVSQKFTYGTKQALKSNTFKKYGYIFAGWTLTEGAAEADFANSEVVDESVLGFEPQNHDNAAVLLYPVWKNTYRIAYHEESEILSPDTADYRKSYVCGSTYKLPVPEKEGYVFGGWYKDEACKKKVASITKSMAEDLYLFAKWTPCTYSIKFNANAAAFTDEKATGSMKNVTGKYDVQTALPANKLSLKGYKFIGWSLTAGKADVAYADAEVVMNLANRQKETVTLYAQWEETPYAITYETNGGVLDTTLDSYHYGDDGVVLPIPEKEGYIFAGWYRDAALKKPVSKNKANENILTQKDYGDMTLYAKWTGKKYEVVYDADAVDATGRTASENNRVYGTSKALVKNGYKRFGYQFMGWSLTPESEATEEEQRNPDLRVDFTNGQKVAAFGAYQEKITLYAVWDNRFTVTFRAMGGVFEDADEEAVSEYTYTEGLSALPIPTREGYTFAGWYRDEKYKKAVSADKRTGKYLAAATDYGNLELYAKWIGNKYDLVYLSDASEATGKMAVQKSRVYGTEKALTKNAFKRLGYVFIGWSLTPEREATEEERANPSLRVDFTNGAKVAALGEYRKNVTLYAVWDQHFSVTIHSQGGTFEDDSTKMTFGYTYQQGIALPTPEKAGYTFAGWYRDVKYKSAAKKDANTRRYLMAATDFGDINLYAKWSGSKYDVIFDADADDIQGKTATQKNRIYGTAKALTKNGYKRSGYRFIGWSMTPESEASEEELENPGLRVDFTDGQKVDRVGEYQKETILYAVWEKVEYTITYYNMSFVGDKEALKEAGYPTSYTVEDQVVLKEPERLGYTFLGWYTDKKCKKRITDIHAGTAKEQVLYAKWRLNN